MNVRLLLNAVVLCVLPAFSQYMLMLYLALWDSFHAGDW